MIQFDENKKYTNGEITQLFNYSPSAFHGDKWKATQQNLKDRGYLVEKEFQSPTSDKFYYTIKKGPINTELYYEDETNQLDEVWIDTFCNSNIEVSNYGRVREKITHRRRKSTIDKTNGYVSVSIEGKTYRLHRLVFKSFNLEYKNDDSPIDHIDGNRQNNKLTNLRIATTLENTAFMLGNRDILQKAITEKLKQGYSYQEILEIIQKIPNKNIDKL